MGSTVAILGSGPSVRLYDKLEDVAIAVNGASFLKKKYDFFVAGDVHAPKRDWWLVSQDRVDKNLITRIVSSYIAPFDPFLYPEEKIRLKLQEELESFMKENKDEDCPYCYFVPSVEPKRRHIFFRFGGFGEEFVDNISSNQEVIYWGGTISAIALQISLVLGFEEINLYGCGFNNFNGINYCYNCPNDQRGIIESEQMTIMQATIDKIRSFDIKIKIHGKSNIH